MKNTLIAVILIVALSVSMCDRSGSTAAQGEIGARRSTETDQWQRSSTIDTLLRSIPINDEEAARYYEALEWGGEDIGNMVESMYSVIVERGMEEHHAEIFARVRAGMVGRNDPQRILDKFDRHVLSLRAGDSSGRVEPTAPYYCEAPAGGDPWVREDTAQTRASYRKLLRNGEYPKLAMPTSQSLTNFWEGVDRSGWSAWCQSQNNAHAEGELFFWMDDTVSPKELYLRRRFFTWLDSEFPEELAIFLKLEESRIDREFDEKMERLKQLFSEEE